MALKKQKFVTKVNYLMLVHFNAKNIACQPRKAGF